MVHRDNPAVGRVKASPATRETGPPGGPPCTVPMRRVSSLWDLRRLGRRRRHAVAEDGIPTCDIAEAIGRALGLPVTSIAPDDVQVTSAGSAPSSVWISRRRAP